MNTQAKKILIGLPNTGYYHFMAVNSLLNLQIPENYIAGFRFMSNCLIYDAREKLAEYAIKEGFDYLVMIDSDMVVPSDFIIKALNLIDNHNYDLVTGLIFKRAFPYQPCFYAKCRIMENHEPYLEGIIEWNDNSILDLEGMGMACCMMDTKILTKMKKPLFYPFPNMGEDLTFCIKARQEAKAKMCADSSIDVGHLGFNTITSHFQKEALRVWSSDKNNDGKRIYMEDGNV